MNTQGYAFDNASDQATVHHDALADLLDGPTRDALTELGGLTGRRCLEVAAGAGSIALWLADRAAEVVATDIAPQHIPAHPRLVVRREDIVTDQPAGTFDLVHGRLVLGHLPRREEALRRMVAALRPGGALLIGEFAHPSADFVVDAPDPATADLLIRYLAAHVATLTARGLDTGWAQRAPAVFADAGLTDVRSGTTAGRWRGGGPGCRLLRAGIPQLRAALLSHGMTDADLTATMAALDDPRVVVNGFPFVQVSGRAPDHPGPA
ncbi:class I SAM-dependent methyltransferase [Micromonospora humidisoli]|uniref:class I SAM-dependent methyltransferase n=1 Tax=Micromonospora sp. AKA109 TaxID=2733865 RepID=UPI002491AC14|nr:class I SAM-dependent methyltransferase [Micromonospora sp. AKA109]